MERSSVAISLFLILSLALYSLGLALYFASGDWYPPAEKAQAWSKVLLAHGVLPPLLLLLEEGVGGLNR